MKITLQFIVIAIVIAIVAYLLYKRYIKESYGGGGYAISSGLAFNNNAKHCFKNFYDPPDAPGYCTTIGPVLI